jgi:hypothetical protein
MEKLKQFLIGVVAVGAAGAAPAQTSGQTPSSQPSKDPFVERRDERATAKEEYQQGKISKEQYNQEKAKEKNKLKATGERGTFERNLEAPNRPSNQRSGK